MKKTVLFLAAAIVPAAWGAPLVCSVEGPAVSPGISQLFAGSGVPMTAYSFDDATSTPLDLYKQNDLYKKNDPSEENDAGDDLGLGFLGTIDHELELNRYIQLNLQNLWTPDPANSEVSMESTPGEVDEPIDSNAPPPAGVEIQSASLNPTAGDRESSTDGYEYNSAAVSSDDAELSSVSGSNAFTWELGVLAASALIGLWLFLRGVLLTLRPSARPVRPARHVRV
jgi:hypothetical protein